MGKMGTTEVLYIIKTMSKVKFLNVIISLNPMSLLLEIILLYRTPLLYEYLVDRNEICTINSTKNDIYSRVYKIYILPLCRIVYMRERFSGCPV